ncbi:right-handed parallel beta-helix repeat-containing protein [uncultured Arthrobacter sp.]|uniref:right-handed parallel beta-helix repeat-containing protein n=1 Tax=uncultured Arthrobacter sp. TaxID=114050 RepID=UPI0025D5ABD9|nr:right-handed parallel beta-helix repeat-containing protein [uncultured Arthrobacter sp.]
MPVHRRRPTVFPWERRRFLALLAAAVPSAAAAGFPAPVRNPGGTPARDLASKDLAASDLAARVTELERTVRPAGRFAAGLLVAADDAPPAVKDAADYVCDGVDDQEEINAALEALSNDRSPAFGSQGGSVGLWGRFFSISAPIRLRAHCEVQGQGRMVTTLQATADMDGGEKQGVFELNSPDTQYTGVRGLGIHGGPDSSCSGIFYEQGRGTEWDASHLLSNLYIYRTGHHGVYLLNGPGDSRLRAGVLDTIRVIEAGRRVTRGASGYVIDSPDTCIANCESGLSAGHGFRLPNANSQLANCKSWFSGRSADGFGQGSGFHLDGHRSSLVGCTAQDNYGHGYFIAGGDHSISGAVADSNGYNGGGGSGRGAGYTGSGFYLRGRKGHPSTVQGTSFDRKYDGANVYQQYGVQFADGAARVNLTLSVGRVAVQPVGGDVPRGSRVSLVS